MMVMNIGPETTHVIERIVDMTLGDQFKEHMALRTELGGLIGENRRLYPWRSVPDHLKSDPEIQAAYAGSHGRPGAMAARSSLGEKNKWLKDKIASTTISNAIGRGEMEPPEERFE